MVNGSRTGMQGVYLVAAELTYRGFLASVTSRNAFGADLLVTDQICGKTWSVQVKTNSKPVSYWLLSKHAKELNSPTHLYVFVTLKGNERPDFHVVTSATVATNTDEQQTANGRWYWFDKSHVRTDSEGWEAVFGDPSGVSDLPSIALRSPSEMS